MPNLNFESNNTLYATHGLHSFAAKCPPQLVKYGLQYYSKSGEIVLDPMAGSGTTLVQSYLMGRNAYGFDIDPLSRMIARVKCRPLNDKEIEKAYHDVKEQTERDIRLLYSNITPSAVRYRATPPSFPNRDYWFDQSVIDALSLLSFHITETPMEQPVRDFLWVAFSSLILAKNSVANARDIIHSRHHYYKHPNPPDVLTKLDMRMKVMRRQMLDFQNECQRWPDVKVAMRSGDARSLSMKDESVDLIFTSPPYATALDYPRAHFLAVAWMREALGITLEEYKTKASKYIGSERGVLPREIVVNECLIQFDITRSIIDSLAESSPRHAALTLRYFTDMYKALNEMHRVLKVGRHAIIVVCPSHIRKLDVPTHKVFAEMGKSIGLKLKHEYQRTIYERLRLLPYMQDAFGKRMNTEYVLIFQKQA